ncbi:MAG: glycosyltransferase family 1 protein [Candidatus Aerophobetes bacterium]|nr:glycosyltransferase family 1 protein [Candidatus Aerophobetes bacterium]
MKIILDARKINDYGIGVYLRNIFQGVVDSGSFDYRILHLKGTDYLNASEKSFIEVSFKNYDFREHLEIPARIRRLKDYYYFSPHYVFPLYLKNRLIVTVHDLIHFKFAHLFKPAAKVELGKFFVKQVKRRAEVIFTDSKTTRNDLIEMFGFSNERIRVIYNGISDIFFQRPKTHSFFQSPYILNIGNLKPHKNLITLLKAFSLIKDRYSDLRLVFVGFRQNKSFMQAIQNLKLSERVIIKGYLKEEELIRYIDGAEFFVFPSLYEGFGFPPLEVMARKKAVVSSTGGSLKEILGENALFFNAESYEELAEKISMFLEDEELRKTYQEKGFHHSTSFRWERTISKYLAALKDME